MASDLKASCIYAVHIMRLLEITSIKRSRREAVEGRFGHVAVSEVYDCGAGVGDKLWQHMQDDEKW
jgi:hypothetical protein